MQNLKKKKHGQSLGEFKLKKIEQETLLDAAKAHTELLLNKKKVSINLINIDLLERQVETDQNRLEKGEISLTDLAQSESSLAGAYAQLITAENDLVSSLFSPYGGIEPTNLWKRMSIFTVNRVDYV